MNTRRYPRSLREAFQDADYACSVERPRRMDWQDRVVLWAGGIALVACIVIVVLP